jgi:hypothetical protein
MKDQVQKFIEAHPVVQITNTGLWGYNRVNGAVDMRSCTFKSERAAKSARTQEAKRRVEIEAAHQKSGLV